MGLNQTKEGNLQIAIRQDLREMQIDGVNWATQVISSEHHEIHVGAHYFFRDFTILGASGAINFGIQTPNTTEQTHIVWDIQAQSEIVFQMYETADLTFDGTVLVARNNNRNSSNTSNWVNFESDPTVNSTGTLIGQFSVGDSGNPVQNTPGGGKREREIILKTNTNYLFRITSTNADNSVSYSAEWYEHTPKE